MSKSITALAILQLRDAGRLRLDDPADLYIPSMKNNSLLTTDAPAITLRHLMSHAAGFPEDNPWGDRQLDDTNEDLIELIRKGTWFSNVPGVAFEYSNLGFALLGQIVEKVSGQSLEQYTEEKIFNPLGMDHTEWEYTKVPPGKLALGYRLIGREWVEEPLLHHGSYGAMGGLITTIEELDSDQPGWIFVLKETILKSSFVLMLMGAFSRYFMSVFMMPDPLWPVPQPETGDGKNEEGKPHKGGINQFDGFA